MEIERVSIAIRGESEEGKKNGERGRKKTLWQLKGF